MKLLFFISAFIISITIGTPTPTPTPIQSDGDSLVSSTMPNPFPEDGDGINTENLLADQSLEGQSHLVIMIEIRVFIFAFTGSKINCKQASACSWVLDNMLNSLSTLQADYSKRCRGQNTAICTCLTGIPDCYQTSQCGMILNGLSQIMQPVITSFTSECSRSNALKWDIHYGVCTFVSSLFPDFLLNSTNHGST